MMMKLTVASRLSWHSRRIDPLSVNLAAFASTFMSTSSILLRSERMAISGRGMGQSIHTPGLTLFAVHWAARLSKVEADVGSTASLGEWVSIEDR